MDPQSDSTGGPLAGVGEYLADLRAFAGKRLALAALLVAAGAVLDGVGIVMLVPLVALFAQGSGSASEIGMRIVDSLSVIGIVGRESQVLAILAAFIVLLALRALVGARRETLLVALGTGYVDYWRRRLFDAIGTARWLKVASMRRTDLEHAITRDVGRLGSGNAQLLQSFSQVALALAQIALVTLFAPVLLAALIVILALVALAALPLVRRASKLGRHQTGAGRATHAVLGDFLASQKLARLHDAQRDFSRQFAHAIADARRGTLEYAQVQAHFRAGFQFVAGLLGCLVLALGLLVFDTPVDIMAIVLIAVARLANPVQGVVQSAQATAHMLPALRALQDMEGRLLAAAEHVPVVAQGGAATPAGLAMSGIAFAYPGRAPVLHGTDLAVAPGECVALSGPTGAGKSTLLDIMAGLLPAQSGAIDVDGRSLHTVEDFARWRAQLAFVPQNPFLFDASIEDNLCWGAPECDADAMAEALRIAQADGFVARLPEGLATRVGERGEALSGGERQRLCLARALLRRPRLLVLDEATNALDEATEAEVMDAVLARRDRWSVLVVTHRATALAHADRVVALGQD